MSCKFLEERNGKFFRCSALAVRKCPPNCKFKVTQQEYDERRKNAEFSLISKGLVVVEKYIGSKKIISTNVEKRSNEE